MEFSTTGVLNKKEIEETFSKRILKHYKEYGYGLWAVILKENNQLIGFAGLINQIVDGRKVVELGYRFDPHYWGQGLATESAEAVCDYAFYQLQLREIVSIIDPHNNRSVNVAKKIGMELIKKTIFYGLDVEIYKLTNSNSY